jgi:chaperonin GroES
MEKKLVMKHDKVLVKPIDESEQLYGSIIVPDLGKERPQLGVVLDVGPGRNTEFGSFVGVSVAVGDTVLVPKIGTLRVEFEGDEYYIVQDREILAVVI